MTPQAVGPDMFVWQGEVQNTLARQGLPVAELCELRNSSDLTACLTVGGQTVLVQVSAWLGGTPMSRVLPADAAPRELGLVAAHVSSPRPARSQYPNAAF